jgi:putative transposase
MIYNPAIHHRRTIRLKGYDYSQEGLYFITMCCFNRKCLFGDVENGEMVLNEYGTIAGNEWLNTPNIRKNVELDVFVIMPNHMHGIIILNGVTGMGELHSPQQIPPDTGKGGLHPPDNKKGELHSPQRSPPQGPSDNIGAIVRGYKGSVTKQLNLLNIGYIVWQRNYWEHIIRNEQSHKRISEYIINNPAKWNSDKFYTE